MTKQARDRFPSQMMIRNRINKKVLDIYLVLENNQMLFY